MSIVDQLVDMGFERPRAQFAFDTTGKVGVEQAMEWLIAHEGENLPEKTEGDSEMKVAGEESTNAEGEAELTESTPGSYKCNDCGKLFRDENGMVFHASKSGHENFSESTETIQPLTEEERKQKAEDLKSRIKAARAAKDEIEKKEKIEKERKRREDGKKMLDMREKQKDDELKAIVDARKREKQEELDARKRVLEQIRLDKEARKARETGQPVPVAQPTSVAAPVPKVDYANAMIQVRLPNGQAVRQSFGANEPLSAVRVWLEVNNHGDGQPFNLLVPFPRKQFSAENYDMPLKELGLVPSASIVLTR